MRKRNTYTLAQVSEYDSRPVNKRGLNWKQELTIWTVICLFGGGEEVEPFHIFICAFASWWVWDRLCKRRDGIGLSVFRGFCAIFLLMMLTQGSFPAVGGLLFLVTTSVWGFTWWEANKKMK